METTAEQIKELEAEKAALQEQLDNAVGLAAVRLLTYRINKLDVEISNLL